MSTVLARLLTLTASLIPEPVVATGLGAPAYITLEGATPISGGFTTVATPAEVAALLAGTQITAQAADDLDAMLAQTYRPTLIYVATYVVSTGLPNDALDALEAASIDFGLIVLLSRVDALNEDAANWVNATQDRKWAHPLILQTASADAITSGKPAALADCEIDVVQMHYHSDATDHQAAAAGGLLGGFPLGALGPFAMRAQLQGVALPTVTGAQAAFAYANDIAILKPLGLGASASVRVIDQTAAYSGVGFSGVVSLMFSIRRLRDAIGSVVQRHAILATPLTATPDGAGEVASAANSALAVLAGLGFFQPRTSDGVALPDGYRVATRIAGTALFLDVLLLIGQEATSISLLVTGQEV